MSKNYEVLATELTGLKTFRRLPTLNIDQRGQLRKIIDVLEDALRPTKTKIGALSEEYQELKAHKKVVEDSEAAKKLLKDSEKEMRKVMDAFVCPDLKFEPVVMGDALSKNDDDDADTKAEKRAYWSLYVELEGTYLV